MKALRGVSIRIDKLTHSIEDAKTGQRFKTIVERLMDVRQIQESHWLFDWKGEILAPERGVYKLVRIEEPEVIQGLVSLEDRQDHIYLNLIENARFNRGKSKKFIGVAGNLFAFACKKSLDVGYEGYVAFDSKTSLIKHYVQSLEAIHSHGQRMFLDEKVAKKLIIRYFSNDLR